MSEDHCIAMESALALYKGTRISAVELTEAAETIRLYCAGKLSVEVCFPVNDSDSSREHIGDIVGIGINALDSSNGIVVDAPAVCGSKVESDVQNKRFSVHKENSSQKENISDQELPTPSRTETVAASGDTEEAARTHGGAA
ncbi:hypothetical protein [Acetobacter ghanensis]|uniref:Uncharacterized protein n=1 Tax=Acetobacter ghanensis TaxID=431306 RepID=A0ABX0KHA0_9PROT|nr:hypothetical protein [Acetobacter ghanensis]NHO39447.1 hypothetical protein [Acetobacter ghanensis]GBQ46487.1 hypothetical protein AA18895_0779 [Acetobacter ghanensis DSM 18895]